MEESTKAVGSLLASVVDSAKNELETFVNQAAADIWKAVNNSATGTDSAGRKEFRLLLVMQLQLVNTYFFCKFGYLLK